MTINIIDPHIHLFDRSRGAYHWLKSENPPFWPDKSVIQRDFSIDDLTQDLAINDDFSLSGFVHIEAGFDNDKPWRELEYLESLSFASLGYESFIAKKFSSIASIDLLASTKDFKLTLKKLQSCHSLVGIRHILDEEALDILSNQQAQLNFTYLNEVTNFIFELQLPLGHESATKVMPLLSQTIASNNQLRFIVNHAGFPPVKAATDHNSDAWSLWRKNISDLAQFSNVAIKCSGMEMVNRQYDMSWFSTMTNFCISKFSIGRVMLASNFPLCLLSKKTYHSYWQDILESSLIKQCSKNEQNALLYNNALNIYQLSNTASEQSKESI